MSLIDFAFGPLVGDVFNDFAIIGLPRMSIDTIIPDVVIEYAGRDEVTIVNQPVQTGATITDHAFKNPVSLRMVCGWSNSTGGAGPGYVEAVYQTVLDLQSARNPFSVTTSQRDYTNMLVASVTKSTDAKNPNALILIVDMQEIILVTIGGDGSTPAPAGTPPVASDGGAMPQATQPSVSTGSVSPSPLPNNVPVAS